MGSLVPGWDTAEAGVPKELQDIDEAKELNPFARPSYFERLEKQKTLRRTGGGLEQPASSLGLERSSSLGMPRGVPSETAGQGVSRSFQASPTMPIERPSLQRISAGGVGAAMSPPKVIPNKYVATDWEAEISALGSPKSSRRSSLGRTSVDSYLAHKPDDTFHRPSWWAQLDSGRMNDVQPDDRDRAAQVEEAPGKGGSVKIDMIGSNLHTKLVEH